MSLLLDSLRRGRGRGGDRSVPPGQSYQADAVLATLGYSPQPRRKGPASRGIVLVAGGAILVALGVWLWPQLGPAPPPMPQAPPARSVAAPTLPAVSPPSGRMPAAAPEPPPQPQVLARERLQPSDRKPSQAVDAVPAAAQRRASRPVRRAPPSTQLSQIRTASPSAGKDTPVPVSARPDDFRLALYYHRSGDFERALAHYRAVLEQNELNAEARNNLGLLYQDKDLLDDAVREFRRAIYINPRYGRAHNNLGVTLMRQDRIDLAAAEFQIALSIDARDTDALVNLALAQTSSRQPEAARTSLLRAITIDPGSAAAHYNLALLYDQAGETLRAIEHYRSFLDNVDVDHARLAPDVRARLESLSARLR